MILGMWCFFFMILGFLTDTESPSSGLAVWWLQTVPWSLTFSSPRKTWMFLHWVSWKTFDRVCFLEPRETVVIKKQWKRWRWWKWRKLVKHEWFESIYGSYTFLTITSKKKMQFRGPAWGIWKKWANKIGKGTEAWLSVCGPPLS